MYQTKNDLPESARGKLVDLLNARLADAIDLQTQCKQAHWNVKGPEFIALHKLFDEVNEAVEEYVDLIAERAVQLGGIADGTARVVAKRSSLPEYPAVKGGDGREHVAALSAVPPSCTTRSAMRSTYSSTSSFTLSKSSWSAMKLGPFTFQCACLHCV